MFVFNTKDARRLAKALTRALERKGLAPALGQVLDGPAQAEGLADWNAWSASFAQAEIDAGLHDFEQDVDNGPGTAPETPTERPLAASQSG